MTFEFDPAKSEANLAKHGIDFDQAQAIWDDPEMLELDIFWQDEPRWLLIGMAQDKLWTAIFTRRTDAIRIISVRRARKKEASVYGEKDDIG